MNKCWCIFFNYIVNFSCCSTTENLTVFVWNSIVKDLPPGCLKEVKIHETEKNVMVYRGEYSSDY